LSDDGDTPAADTPAAATPAASDCPRCLKPAALCVCADVAPIENRVALLILQHPQEQDQDLGTARLTALHFANAVFKIGLSWPSLAKALGRPADPRRWATLYLGSAAPAELAPDRAVVALDAKGKLLPDQDAALAEIEGIILLDGTWSQAKSLWWRNPWLLKSRRVVLNPAAPSLYGALRREPRKESLSTLEAAALLLGHLEGRPDIEAALTASFARMLARYRANAPARPKIDWRRGRGPRRAKRR